VADYRYAGESVGPVEFKWNTADFTTLPGVVLAFGKRAAAGDKVAVVTTADRTDTAKVYGGKFEASFELEVITRDSNKTEEVGDLIFMYLWENKKGALEYEGIEIMDVSLGGESEELYDETGDLYYYQSSVSVQLRGDWEAHKPLPLTISRVTPEDPLTGVSGIKAMGQEIFYATEPVLKGLNNDFERIG
jgi:hypothetical protein